MYKIAVIGDKVSILGFKAVGLSTFIAENPTEAKNAFKETTKDLKYGIIYVTENIASMLEEEIDEMKSSPLPAIIPILGVEGNTGIGIANVKKSVERAVGSDIVFGSNES